MEVERSQALIEVRLSELQYFIDFDEFCNELPFDSSLMVHFRKRLTLETFKGIHEKMCLDQSTNEEAIPPDDDSDDPPNQGTLIVNATCTPANITSPTDVKLLNDCREKTEEIIDKRHDLRQGKRSLAHTGIKPGRIF